MAPSKRNRHGPAETTTIQLKTPNTLVQTHTKPRLTHLLAKRTQQMRSTVRLLPPIHARGLPRHPTATARSAPERTRETHARNAREQRCTKRKSSEANPTSVEAAGYVDNVFVSFCMHCVYFVMYSLTVHYARACRMAHRALKAAGGLFISPLFFRQQNSFM